MFKQEREAQAVIPDATIAKLKAPKQLKVGDQVRFMLGETPMTGEILFAFGPNAVAVKLTSGAEITIDLDCITR